MEQREVRDIDALNAALNSVKVLRSNVRRVFESVSNGLRSDHGEDGKENKYILELQELLTTVNNNLREVEGSVANLTPPPGPFTLGNTTYLSQETTLERQQLYGQLVNNYKWTDKIRAYSVLAGDIFESNKFVKTHKSTNLLVNQKRRKPHAIHHNVPPEIIETFINGIGRFYNDMTVTANRPAGPNPVIQISLGRVFKAIIAFKGLIIEFVTVKSLSENNDLWSESRYKVFRKVSDHCNAAMCHFFTPYSADTSIKSYMEWLHSYITLFSAPCKGCSKRLNSNMPPTWRNFTTLEAYHEECK
ncbi:hypothetical protein ABEB36_001454 [Hypothenemus hampei]|uniref:Mediator of RNA polymerase II transcription subunit 27 n=1 Tax=Hypothenemus hampei TaxID=57062 RepID=A0ABD1FEL6_HYPHA